MRGTLSNSLLFVAANLKERLAVNQVERYCIRSAYKHRDRYEYFDDTTLKDEWQREVYEHAAKLAKEENLKTVYDVGCGSGFKLMKHFRSYDTIGFDVPETLPHLQKTYPDRIWKFVSFLDRNTQPADLVICADVIEHVESPLELMNFLKSLSSKWVVISTPDRDLMYPPLSPFRLGPPRNPCHIREWSSPEFKKFVSKYLNVKEHAITNQKQATQMIIATV